MSDIDLFESNYETSIKDSDLSVEVDVTTQLSNPFSLQWTFGFDPFTPVINLSTAVRSLIAYASSHVTVLYDFESRKMFKMQGHRNCVRMLSTDHSGRWLLSADFDNDSTVVIWGIEKRIPIFTLFNPHKENGITAVALSPDAKFIVTVGNEDIQLVKVWYWTFGKKEPDAETSLTEVATERVKDIAFDWKNPNFFALTTESHVIFVLTDHEEHLITDCPSILKKPSGLGIFNNSTFIMDNSKVFTGTENGFILVWDKDFDSESDNDMKMIHIKSHPSQKANITKIINYLCMIVTGNSRGEIIFYDSDLQVLYACRDCGLDFITSISFDIQFEGHCLQRDCSENDDDYMNVLNTSNSIKQFEDSEKSLVEIASNVTIKIEHPPKPRNLSKTCDTKKCLAFKEKFEKFNVTRDATMEANEFSVDTFIVATKNGKMAWIDIPGMQCRKISHYFNSPVTAIDVHPRDKYLVVGDKYGSLYLFNYVNHQLSVKKQVPDLPDLVPILKTELLARRIIHVTYSNVDTNKKPYPSAIKYSNNADAIICALDNGAFWVLHPDTFDVLDEIPYRHSETTVLDVVFSACSEYMAYYDDARTVVVFKRHRQNTLMKPLHYYDFVGKYRSHNSPIRCILFGLPTREEKKFPRLLSLGEDKVLIEYNLVKSGTYPYPGLIILNVSRVDQEEIPFVMDWYPQFNVEKCLVISNSDHKLKLINVDDKTVRATILGSTCDTPIKKIIVHQEDGEKNIAHMIFATDKKIGLQLLPLDGNPYKILTAIGHPRKITWMRTSHCGNLLFTSGQNDRSILMWKINYKSVEITHRLGGIGLDPFYNLIDGGKEGWLFQEMQDLFVYAQILEQGKNSMKARRIDDEVTVDQLPNLVRAVGFYPSNYQLDNLMKEVIYKDYASSGRLNKRLTFEEFVKLYINHRPTFGISLQQLKDAFATLGAREKSDDLSISKQLFFDVLCSNKYGDTLDMKEICRYLEYLIYGSQSEHYSKIPKLKSKSILQSLPPRISYKDFVANVLGIKIPKEIEAVCQRSTL